MEKEIARKIEETVVKLLDLVPLVDAVVKLAEVLKDIEARPERTGLNIDKDEFARMVVKALNEAEKKAGRSHIGGLEKRETLAEKGRPYYGVSITDTEEQKMDNGRPLHKLEIKDGVLYLDGTTFKGLVGYELKSSAEPPTTELTLKLNVEDSKVNSPEIISPITALKKLTGGTMTGTLVTSSIQKETKDMDERRVREIVITGEIIEASSNFGGTKETVRTFTGAFTAPSIKLVLKDMDEQGLRKIVKEELAALAERPTEKFILDVIKAISEREKEATKPSLHL